MPALESVPVSGALQYAPQKYILAGMLGYTYLRSARHEFEPKRPGERTVLTQMYQSLCTSSRT